MKLLWQLALGLQLNADSSANNDRRIALQLLDETSTCQAKRHIMFHKKHKSASSTLAAILKDWSRKQRLLMAKTPVPAFIGGYPAPFDPNLVQGLPRNGTKFDIILHHLRFKQDSLQQVLNDDTIYLTSMRKPLSHFVSTFEFFYGRFSSHEKMQSKSDKGESLTCWGHPFVDFLGGPGRSIHEYVNNAEYLYDSNVPWHFRGKNFQAYELGIDTDAVHTAPQREEAVEKVKNQFDLIMVTEHYWESLVMMKDLLCMDWYDLYIDSRTVGSYEKPTFTDREKAKFEKFNKLDEELYQMSNSTFWEKAEQRPGGIDQLNDDVEKLKALYRYCDQNVDFCKKIKNKKIDKHDDVINEFATDETFEDDIDKFDYLMARMKEHHGDCPYGFYQQYHDMSETSKRQMVTSRLM